MEATLKLSSESFVDGQSIPVEFAFGRIDPKQHVALSDNRNPQLRWEDVPPGTRSFAVICHDYDVPSKPDDVNQDGREVPADLPRVDFFHWVLVDLPADCRAIDAGEHADGVTPKGKTGPTAPGGARHGINDYTSWFSGDPDMAGDYYGYDGPCPPWNDSVIHHYVFTVYALDVETLPVKGRFTGADALKAIHDHALGQASLTGTYTLNPRLA